MNLTLIAAVADNNVIGYENRLIWHMSADLKRFKEITMGHTLIMGRKTFESVGKPLPGRKTIIITRQKDYEIAGCITVSSLEEAAEVVKEEKEAFIAGGAEIYRQAINLSYTKNIILTRIFAEFEGDTYFPDIDPYIWELIEKTDFNPDTKNPYPYSFMLYRRKLLQ